MAKEKKVFKSKWISLGGGRTVHVLDRSRLVEQAEKRGSGFRGVKLINEAKVKEIQDKLSLETGVKPLPAKVRGASPSGEVDFAAFIGPVTPVK
jgi:hypothetical protein